MKVAGGERKCGAQFEAATERLAVVTRGAVGNDIALAIALARGVPVLSIDTRERGRGDR